MTSISKKAGRRPGAVAARKKKPEISGQKSEVKAKTPGAEPGAGAEVSGQKSEVSGKNPGAGPGAVRPLRHVLIDVIDELHDLVAVLGCVREVRLMSETLRDIFHPPSPDDAYAISFDRIGRAGVEIDRAKWAQAVEKVERYTRDAVVDADLIDMRCAADAIIGGVRLRLARMIRLIEIARQAAKAKSKVEN